MFRFSIRDVLWLTVAVAVGLALSVGWWRERNELLADQAEMRQWINVVKNKVIWAEEAKPESPVRAPNYPVEP